MTSQSNRPSKYKNRCCDECGSDYTPRRKDEFFCSTPCRKAFENRRAVRGAEMYDLFRAMRRERDVAKAEGIWSKMCQLELRWQIEDEKERPGRRSYREPKRAIKKLEDDGRLQIGVPLQTTRIGPRSV